MLEIQVKQPDIPRQSLKGNHPVVTKYLELLLSYLTSSPVTSQWVVIDPSTLVRPPRPTSLLAAWCAASVKGFYLRPCVHCTATQVLSLGAFVTAVFRFRYNQQLCWSLFRHFQYLIPSNCTRAAHLTSIGKKDSTYHRNDVSLKRRARCDQEPVRGPQSLHHRNRNRIPTISP